MVLVMVVTGAGKSYFVNKLKEGAIVEGSDMDALRTFQELGNFRPEERNTAFKRETELRDKFWKGLVGKGSQVPRFDGDTASAQGLVSQLIRMKEDVVLALQQELPIDGKKLNDTSAGAFLAPYLDCDEDEIRRELKELSTQIKEEKNKTVRAAAQQDIARTEARNARV